MARKVGTARRAWVRGCGALLPWGQPRGRGEAGPLDADLRRAHHVRVSRWARVRLKVSIAIGAAGLLVGAGYAIYAHLDSLVSHLAWTALVVLPVYALAVWLVSVRPEHPQARRLLLIAVASAVGVAVESVVRGVYSDVGPGAWVWVANLFHQYSSLVAGAAGGVLLASYPEGELERAYRCTGGWPPCSPSSTRARPARAHPDPCSSRPPVPRPSPPGLLSHPAGERCRRPGGSAPRWSGSLDQELPVRNRDLLAASLESPTAWQAESAVRVDARPRRRRGGGPVRNRRTPSRERLR
jgi:hypothetical protein